MTERLTLVMACRPGQPVRLDRIRCLGTRGHHRADNG